MKNFTTFKVLMAVGLVVASVAVVTGGCGLRPSTDHREIRRVILVVVDTLRGDHLTSSVSTGEWAELDDESRSRLEALGYVN